MLLLKLFHYLQVGFFSSVDIIKVFCHAVYHKTIFFSISFVFQWGKDKCRNETKLDFISSIWDDDHILRLDKKIGNAYGVIQISKEWMLLRLLLAYWGRTVCILKVVMLLRPKFTQQDTKNLSITNRLRRVFFLIIQIRSKNPSQVYKISHRLPSSPPSIVVPKVSLHKMTLIHL